jgi:uncharacterized RDD family membrane protein YckC
VKCPKCDYIGFEAVDRCRNCGYEFALALTPAVAAELEMRSTADGGGPLIDLSLAPATPASGSRRRTPSGKELDLDRIIGAPDAAADLPLFEESRLDPPAVLAPPPARRPLAVRRVTPVPRGRPASGPDEIPTRNLELPLPQQTTRRVEAGSTGAMALAAPVPRVLAALLDTALLLSIDALVLYFTLRLCSLPLADAAALPLLPLAVFFLLLNGGYLVAFTSTGGQTIGKMAFGLKVVGPDDDPIPVGTASLRSAACLVSAVLLGAGLLPVVLGGRAVHDRLTGTRVVQVAV